MDSKKGIAATEIFPDGIFQNFPFDSIIGWNIKAFGPPYVPGKGDSITLNRLLPEEYIVGKAWIIWKSVDSHTEKLRWDRFLKEIH